MAEGNPVQRWLADVGGDLLSGDVPSFQGVMIHGSKRRIVHAAPFRERVIHHTIMNVAGPVFGRIAIADSYAVSALRT